MRGLHGQFSQQQETQAAIGQAVNPSDIDG
jgi:hypothetical protein